MKKLSFLFSVILLSSLALTTDLEARGGGGGRGGGGARAGGAARSAQRSPSMSRAATRPAPTTMSRPQTAQARPQAAQARPQAAQARPQVNQARPPAAQARSQVNRSDVSRPAGNVQRTGGNTRGQVQQFMKDNPTNRPNQLPNRPNQLPSSRPGQNLPARNVDNFNRAGQNLGQQLGANRNTQNIGQNIRNNVGLSNPNRGDWFNNSFLDKHDIRPPYYNNGGNWWGLATAAGVGSWLGWQSQPLYYGSAEDYWGPTDSSGSPVYSETPAPATYTEPGYTQQTQSIDAAASTLATNNEWTSLGVFAVTKNTENTASPNMYLQLAINKEGYISGVFYNATLDKTQEIEGLVDQGSQRAAWKIADNDSSPIMETGIFNLTLPEASARVHFPDGTTQDVLLVRLEQPAGNRI